VSGYECVDCGRVINVDVPRCLICRQKMKKRGVCWWCGSAPVKSPRSGYCEACQASAIEQRNRRETRHEDYVRKLRGSDARENTHETKRGG
jgi:predicted amidophosphoribosyltransferase